MENIQNLNYKLVDIEHSRRNSMQFSILLDTGNHYVPGQLVSKRDYCVIYCRSNCGMEFVADGTYYRMQRGDILLIKPDTPPWRCFLQQRK